MLGRPLNSADDPYYREGEGEGGESERESQ